MAVEVFLEQDATAQYTDWELAGRNYALTPRATAGMPDGVNLAERWAGGGTWAQSISVLTGLPPIPGTDITTAYRKTYTATSSGGPNDFSFGIQRGANRMAVTPGESIAISFWIRPSWNAGLGGIYNRIEATGWNAITGGSQVGSVVGPALPNLIPNVWQRISAVLLIPAGVTYIEAWHNLYSGGSNWPIIGSTLDVTGLLVERSTLINPWYDGNVTYMLPRRRFTWAGTVGASETIAEQRSQMVGPTAMGGGVGSVTDYHVSQDATPISATDTSGATPSFSVTVGAGDFIETIRQRGKGIMLHDDEHRGIMLGTVDGFSNTPDGLQYNAITPLTKLVGHVDLQPYSGTLGAYINALLFRIDETIEIEYRGGVGDVALILPALSGSAWDILKDLCVANQIECAMRGAVVSLRPIRGASFNYETVTDVSHVIEAGPRARKIEVTAYDSVWSENRILYPSSPAERERTRSSYPTAGANQRMLLEYRLENASAATIAQPVCVSGGTDVDALGASCYVVLDRDNVPIDPAWWTSAGGSVTVDIIEGNDALLVAFVTPAETSLAPYSMAMLDADGNPVFSLRICGSGTFMDPEVITFSTGANEEDVIEEVGTSINLSTLQDRGRLYTAAKYAMQEYSSPRQTLSASLGSPRLIALSPDWATVLFSEFDADVGGMSFTAFNAAYAGLTFQQFNDLLDDQALARFSEQLFSVLVGGRVRYGFAYFRITQVSVSQESITVDAVADTTVDDIETLWSGYTNAEIETLLEGVSWEEWELTPLRLGGNGSVYGQGYYGDGIYGGTDYA